MARGDVILVNLPVPSGPSGHEQVGLRPAIVVQADISSADLPTTIVIPMTSSQSASRFPHTISVDPSPHNGLSTPSFLLVFQLRAIDKRRLGNKIGRLEDPHLEKLEAEMRQLLGL
jgi:mRNA interferase MazF